MKMALDRGSQFANKTYCLHNVVERCVSQVKAYWRIATRYNRMGRNYVSMIKLGRIRLFYKKVCN